MKGWGSDPLLESSGFSAPWRSGGAAVGPFSVTDVTRSNIDVTLGFTGIGVLQTLPLGSDLVLQWTGGDSALQNGNVTITAWSYSQVDGHVCNAGYLLCTALLSAQTFTIPQRVLEALPVTGAVSYGMISIGQYNTPTSFTATGLTRGIITDIFNNATWVKV